MTDRRGTQKCPCIHRHWLGAYTSIEHHNAAAAFDRYDTRHAPARTARRFFFLVHEYFIMGLSLTRWSSAFAPSDGRTLCSQRWVLPAAHRVLQRWLGDSSPPARCRGSSPHHSKPRQPLHARPRSPFLFLRKPSTSSQNRNAILSLRAARASTAHANKSMSPTLCPHLQEPSGEAEEEARKKRCKIQVRHP